MSKLTESSYYKLPFSISAILPQFEKLTFSESHINLQGFSCHKCLNNVKLADLTLCCMCRNIVCPDCFSLGKWLYVNDSKFFILDIPMSDSDAINFGVGILDEVHYLCNPTCLGKLINIRKGGWNV